MDHSFLAAATNALQYDSGEINWVREGRKPSHIQRVLLEVLQPYIATSEGRATLDVGCGTGWLVHEFDTYGARATGVDPSTKNIEEAKASYQHSTFFHSSLADFGTQDRYDLITAVMVFEHFYPLAPVFAHLKSLLAVGGKVVIIAGDLERFTTPRFGYSVEVQQLPDGAVATRTDYGERSGVLYDVFRPISLFTAEAEAAGFIVKRHQEIAPPVWLLEEKPRYAIFRDQPMFHLYELIKN